ncbi:reverse transcriptase domain-containing protein [Tanacetum coccineum]
MDVFVWEPADMTGIPRRIIEHSFNVNPSIEPVAQKRRVMASDRTYAIIKEVGEWMNVGVVRPVKYPTWISIPVLIKKGDESWKMCIDFKNFNSVCPKDYYPLSDIDGKIESVVGFRYKCFLDAYKGYHQVQIALDDEEKTTFYTDHGTYCYTKMPFGLKNTGATYQRLVDTTFQSQIGRNLEAYVDDMVIKSNDEKVLIADIAETFDNLRRINMKLNPKKCSFGAEEGKFLGYMVTSEGIRANPKKTKAITDMQSPRTLKEMHSLSGKLAALKRFLSRSAKKSLPFFETLKDITKENKDEYRWTENAKKAFQEMKKFIVELPLLTTPVKEETMYVYMAAATEAVSTVLLTEREGKQCPIQYVSRTLNEAERNYAPLEKLALSLLHMSRRLRRYFEAHPIKVITDQPLKQILNKDQASGKLAKYSVELGAYNITYEPRNAIKAGVPNKDGVEKWTLLTDGASNSKGSRAGLVLISPSGVEFTYALRLNFTSTNNEAEYEALLAGLRMARKMKVAIDRPKGGKCYRGGGRRQLDDVHHTLSGQRSMAERQGGKEGPENENKLVCPRGRARFMVAKAIRQGYYWPTMHMDARNVTQKCDSCQVHAPVLRRPKMLMTSIMVPWPFYQWGMDILRALPQASGKLKFVIVAIDYFTKWIEAKSLARITGKNVKKFVWENIVCRFGLPRIIVTDNGTQFFNDPFKGWCERLNIKNMNTAVAHPQANGLIERANKSLMEGIKARLGRERA